MTSGQKRRLASGTSDPATESAHQPTTDSRCRAQLARWSNDLILWLSLAATFGFGLSGGLAAVRARLDLFGVLVLATVVGLAGGISTRDLLIGVPPETFRDGRYFAAVELPGSHASSVASSSSVSIVPFSSSTRSACRSSASPVPAKRSQSVSDPPRRSSSAPSPASAEASSATCCSARYRRCCAASFMRFPLSWAQRSSPSLTRRAPTTASSTHRSRSLPRGAPPRPALPAQRPDPTERAP